MIRVGMVLAAVALMSATDRLAHARMAMLGNPTQEGHARFWERPEVKFLRATRHFQLCPAPQRRGRSTSASGPREPERACIAIPHAPTG